MVGRVVGMVHDTTLDGTIIVTKNSLVGPDYNGNFDRNIHNQLELVVMPN